MEEKEMVVKDEKSLMEEMKVRNFCSISCETTEEKKTLYNALEECDVLLNDCVGQTIDIKDVYCEEKEVIDEETGEVKTKFRTIIFAQNGQTYATGSYGIFNSIRKIMSIFGAPTYSEGEVVVEVAKRPIGNGKSSLILKLV